MIDWKKISLKTTIEISDEYMEKLNIPKVILKDEKHKDDPELWRFCNFYRHKKWNKKKKYIVSTYGRVYNIKSSKMVSISQSSGYSITSDGTRYLRVNICIGGEQTAYYMHNLVAHTFLHIPKKKNMVVDHIDENPKNNCIWNLQFVSRNENTNLHNMRMAQKFMEEGVNLTKKSDEQLKKLFSPDGSIINTSWTDDEIRHICRMIAQGHKATYIYKKLLEEKPNNLKIDYERIRTLYKHIIGKRHSFKEIAKECSVVFPEESGLNPYLKEPGSVKAVKE